MSNPADNAIQKTVDSITKDLPELVKSNKGAAIGAVIGYVLADKLNENDNIITAVLGGLVGHAVDEKNKKNVF